MADVVYRTFTYKLGSGHGLVARYQYDRLPPGTYRNLDSLESRAENAIATRYGLAVLSTDGVGNLPLGSGSVQSISRMQGLSTPYNYATSQGGGLYRRTGDAQGGYTIIANGLANNSRVSMYPYRPNASSNPWLFVADNNKMLKDDGTLSFSGGGHGAQNWGIAPPRQPALIAPSVAGSLPIELFDEANTSSFTLVNVSSSSMISRITTNMSGVIATGVQSVTTAGIGAGAGFLTRAGGVTTFSGSLAGIAVSGNRIGVNCLNPADASFNVVSVVTNAISYPNAGPNGSNVGTVTVSAAPSLMAGMFVTTTDANAESVYITEVISVTPTANYFVANFTQTHAVNTPITSNYLSATIAANQTATITKAVTLNLSTVGSIAQVDSTSNLIQLFLNVANPLAIQSISISFDVGDGTFTQDYYSKTIQMSPAQTVASGTINPGVAQSAAVSQRAIGGVNFSTLGGDNPTILPGGYPLLGQMQPQTINPGANPWTLVNTPLSSFVSYGNAGNAGQTWANVVAWRISITTQPNLGTTVGLDDLALIGGSDLNSFAGQAYDYRYTYYNINTGCESTPSVEMIGTSILNFYQAAFVTGSAPVPLSVQNQAIAVTPLQPTDPQVTHINIYRRGGTLTQAWYYVARIPVGQAVFLDTIADSVIENNDLLNINQDAPVTALLPKPLNTTFNFTFFGGGGLFTGTLSSGTVVPGQLVTLGSGTTQEQCYIISVAGPNVTLYTQLSTSTTVSTPLSATTTPQQPMDLMAIAFDKAWLAGDPNNPHILYYSTTYQPETFPVQNFLEVGTPDAPIMALVELNGMLFVFTTKRVYEVLGAGSAVPSVIPTGVKHGLAAHFAWCCSENRIYYLSYDGIYVFSGGGSQYLSEPVEWIWTGKNLGPVPSMNTLAKGNTVMAYANHEVFINYYDQNGIPHRLIYHEVYQRWRNDEFFNQATAMYFSEDIGALFVGDSAGMIYQDRVNDFDSGGYAGGVQIQNPISFNLQTAQMDQSEVDPTYAKRNKLYNEVTIDADLNGQTVAVSLVLDSGNTVKSLGTITGSGSGREQFQLNINNGDGYESLNVGLLITGSTTVVLSFFEVHIRAAIQAEFRQSWDTWWMGQGSAEWKLYKQVWAEYAAQDPAGVVVQAFIDGDMSAPVFSFTLPQTTAALPNNANNATQRASKKFRFPATKCRMIRFIGTSASKFQIYDDTMFEYKILGSSKGYTRGKISP